MVTFTTGSVTADGTEQNLFTTITADKFYAIWIFTHNMAAGDTTRIRVYVKDTDGTTDRIYRDVTLTNAQTEPAFYSPPIGSQHYRVSLQQTAGTNRTYTWRRAEV